MIKCVVPFMIFLILLLFIYNYYLVYTDNIHLLQDKKLIEKLWDIQILGINNKKYMEVLSKNTELSFWYTYTYNIVDDHVIFFIIIKPTRFTKFLDIYMYSINLNNNNKTHKHERVDFSNVKSYKKNNKLYLRVDNKKINYVFDIKNNKINITFNLGKGFNYESELSITSWITTQPSYIERFYNLKSLPFIGHIMDGNSSGGKEEWCIDNPFIGNITYLKYNNKIYNNGNYWLDTYIGNQDYIMTDYIWFFLLNDDWVIYLLWYCDNKSKDNKKCTKVFKIKDRKNNKMIHSGVSLYPYNLGSSINMSYNYNNTIGDELFDDYQCHFKSDKIEISIKSIKNKSERLGLMDPLYWNNDDGSIEDLEFKDKNEEQYYRSIFNIKYAEYVNRVNVNINYNNKLIKYKNQVHIIDTCF